MKKYKCLIIRSEDPIGNLEYGLLSLEEISALTTYGHTIVNIEVKVRVFQVHKGVEEWIELSRYSQSWLNGIKDYMGVS